MLIRLTLYRFMMLVCILDYGITKSSVKYKFVLVAVILSNTAQIITVLSKTALKDYLSVGVV